MKEVSNRNFKEEVWFDLLIYQQYLYYLNDLSFPSIQTDNAFHLFSPKEQLAR